MLQRPLPEDNSSNNIFDLKQYLYDLSAVCLLHWTPFYFGLNYSHITIAYEITVYCCFASCVLLIWKLQTVITSKYCIKILDRNNMTEINKLRTYFLILTIVKILLTCRMNYTQHSHPKSCHLEFCFKYPDLASSARSHLPGMFQWYL